MGCVLSRSLHTHAKARFGISGGSGGLGGRWCLTYPAARPTAVTRPNIRHTHNSTRFIAVHLQSRIMYTSDDIACNDIAGNHKATASLPAVKPGTHSVAMAKLQGGNAPVDNEAHVMILMISQAIMI